MVADTKPKENKKVFERKKLKGGRETMEVGETNKKVEKTSNYTKSLDTTGKNAVCGGKDPRLDN
jgi:hypothetical protein